MDKKEAVVFLKNVAAGLAVMFGRHCETLIHDMSVPGHPIVAISNGHVSGREIGSKLDIYGNEDEGEHESLTRDDFVNHLVVRPGGQKIKSSTFHMRGEDYHYALGINFDFTQISSSIRFWDDFSQVGIDLQSAITQSGQIDMAAIFDEALQAVDMPIKQMGKDDRKLLVGILQDQKLFSLRKSVPFVAGRLGVSRYTIYKYLKELAEEGDFAAGS